MVIFIESYRGNRSYDLKRERAAQKGHPLKTGVRDHPARFGKKCPLKNVNEFQ